MRQNYPNRGKTGQRRGRAASCHPPCREPDTAQSPNVLGNSRVITVHDRFDRDAFKFGEVDVAIVSVLNEGNFPVNGFVEFAYLAFPSRKVRESGIARGSGLHFHAMPWEPLR